MNRWICLTSYEPGTLVVGLGATTSLGRSAWASAAAVRAGVAGFESHPYMIDAVGRPMKVAAFPWIVEDRGIADRVADALVAALREALAALMEKQPRPRLALFLNLPAPKPGMPEAFTRDVVARVQDALPGMFEPVKVASLGHAGGLIALNAATELIAGSPDTLCVVAGADSYLEPDVLEWLESTEQLHGAGERNNAWGFIPGEGAGALLLASAQAAQREQLRPFALVRGIGIGRETELIGTGAVCTGIGLTQAVRSASAALQESERLTDVYCDMNGEPYRADEFAFLVTRMRERFVAASDFVAPADCWGDVGAATAPLLIGLACIAGSKGYSKGDAALVWASSLGGERAAAVIQTAAAAR